MTNLIFRGDCLSTSGYAQTNRLYVCGLVEAGVNVSLIEQHDNYEDYLKDIDPYKANILREAIQKPIGKDYIYFSRSVWSCYHSYPNAIKNIGSTVWECDHYPNSWLQSINERNDVDMIVVPSYFNKNMLQDKINKPVEVVREGLDLELFDNISQEREVKDTFNFLSIFQWVDRKGYDVLLDAFYREFNENDNVALIIKTTSLAYECIPSSSILSYLASFKYRYRKRLNLYVSTNKTPYQDILNLYKKSHCFVLPTRAEGYGIPALEAMASNLPLIITGWSGHTDFCNNDNSYLINYQMQPVRNQWYAGEFDPSYMNWAEPDVQHLQYLMRHIYENYNEAKEKAKKAKEMSKNYCYKEVAKDLKEVLFR